MKIVTWAAVAVTALFALMNLGAAWGAGTDQTALRVVAGVLAAAGVAAAAGLATGRPWGRGAVIGVGAANVVVAVVGVVAGTEGAAVGLVVGGLCVVLGALAPVRAEQPSVA